MCRLNAAVALGLALLASSPALAETPWQVYVRAGLTGTWTASCATTPSVQNMWYVTREDEGGKVFRISYRGPNTLSGTSLIDRAEVLDATRVRLHELSREPGQQAVGFTIVLEQAPGRMRVLDSIRDDGTVLARNGVNVASGQPTRWLEKCAQAVPPGMPLPSQVTNEGLMRCWSKDTHIPPPERVRNCTEIIEHAEREGFSAGDRALLYSNRGIAYAAQERTDQAIEDYTRAITLKSDFAEAYYNRANAYGRKRLYEQAIADYTASIRLQPDVPGYINRAWTYERMGRTDLAIADYRLALALDPASEHALSALRRLGVTR